VAVPLFSILEVAPTWGKSSTLFSVDIYVIEVDNVKDEAPQNHSLLRTNSCRRKILKMSAALWDCVRAFLIPVCSALGLSLSKKIPKWIANRKRRKRKSRKTSSTRPLRPETEQPP